jgi:hypothetical protein
MADMNPVELEPAEKCRFWKEQIERQLQSKMSQAQFCEQNGLKLHQFTYWKYIHGKKAVATEVAFVSVPVAGFLIRIVRIRAFRVKWMCWSREHFF